MEELCSITLTTELHETQLEIRCWLPLQKELVVKHSHLTLLRVSMTSDLDILLDTLLTVLTQKFKHKVSYNNLENRFLLLGKHTFRTNQGNKNFKQ